MITGAHFLIYSKDAEADRAFFRDVLKFPWVEVSEGWLIFALPPAEIAIHPVHGKILHRQVGHAPMRTNLFLMCDDLAALVKSLKRKKIKSAPIAQASWGMNTLIQLPSGVEIGLYQPTHPTAHNLQAK
jgi:predicted enzyme related to lactoylglutathione lyase